MTFNVSPRSAISAFLAVIAGRLAWAFLDEWLSLEATARAVAPGGA